MSSAELILQRSIYIGNAFSAILYGAQLVMGMQSIYYLLHTPKGSPKPRQTFLISYTIVLAVLIAIGFGANMLFGQYMWIERGPNTPGGAVAYFAENTAWWVNTFGSSAGVTANFVGDGYLLHRCYIIMGSSLWIMAFPALIFLSSTALAIVSTIESARPNSFLLSGHPANFGVPWISLTVSFNVIVTCMICWRLISAHYGLRGTVSQKYIDTYTGVTALLVESALPLTVSGLVLAVLYGRNSPITYIWAGIWGIFTGISPQLIILRVAMGVAWSQDTIANGRRSELVFAEDHATSTDFTGYMQNMMESDATASSGTKTNAQGQNDGDGPSLNSNEKIEV